MCHIIFYYSHSIYNFHKREYKKGFSHSFLFCNLLLEPYCLFNAFKEKHVVTLNVFFLSSYSQGMIFFVSIQIFLNHPNVKHNIGKNFHQKTFSHCTKAMLFLLYKYWKLFLYMQTCWCWWHDIFILHLRQFFIFFKTLVIFIGIFVIILNNSMKNKFI